MEKKSIQKMMDSIIDYVSNRRLQEPARDNTFIRAKSTKSGSPYYNIDANSRQQRYNLYQTLKQKTLQPKNFLFN